LSTELLSLSESNPLKFLANRYFYEL